LGITDEELEIMNRIDKTYTDYPFYGVRKITEELRRQGSIYNHKRIYRLMKLMGIEAIRPRKNLSKPNKDHLVYPYLLRNIKVTISNQVWSSDIT
jgi:putative transposase